MKQKLAPAHEELLRHGYLTRVTYGVTGGGGEGHLTHDLAYDPAPKEVALAQEYLTTYGPERAAFAVRHALEAARAVDFPIQTFGGTRNFLPQALAAWERCTEVEETRRKEDARVVEQLRHEREERERRQRLADRRAALSDEGLATLRHRAEEALAIEGVERVRLGYEVLVKLKLDDLLERDDRRMAVEDGRESLEGAA